MVENNATTKIIGFEYQKLIALEHIFNAKRGDTIYIECYGDVSDGVTQNTETKHHFGNSYLTDKSVDFWKTLHNIITEIDVYEDFTSFTLHTTSKCGPNTIFTDWNNYSPQIKAEKIKAITPNDTIASFHKVVIDSPDPILISVLQRLSIKTSQPKIDDQIELLKNHPIFNTLQIKDTHAVLERLHGHISLQAIGNEERWHVSKEDFLKIFQSEVKKYLIEEIQFPLIKSNQVDERKLNAEFSFAKELDEIEYSSVKPEAILQYLRASKSQMMMIEKAPNIEENLIQFDENVVEEVSLRKAIHCNNCKEKEFEETEYKKISRNLFDDCMKIPLLAIPEVKNLQLYYQRGRIHSLIEDAAFSWIINKKT